MRNFSVWSEAEVGDPLYLTPLIEAGDIEAAREMARVDSSLLEVSHLVVVRGSPKFPKKPGKRRRLTPGP